MCASAGRGVFFSRLTLTHFRNYAFARILADGRPLIFTGPNGAGKTNILEAASYLVPGRGLRGSELSDVRQAGQASPWAVAAVCDGFCGPASIGTGLDENGRRVAHIGGVPVSALSALGEHLAMLWITPRMDRLFSEGASDRRRFFDRMVASFDPAHSGRLARHEKLLRERSRLLEAGSHHPAWLDALEAGLAETGVAVAAARRDLAERLTAVLAASGGTFPALSLEMVGEVEESLGREPALAVEDMLRMRLRDGRAQDALTGGASCGAHRSDLAAVHLETGMPAELCSTGQQKALVVAMVLGQVRLLASVRGLAPILLLDEVAAHFDEKRREALFDEISGLGVQAFMTGTDAGIFSCWGDSAQHWRVEDAHLFPRLQTV